MFSNSGHSDLFLIVATYFTTCVTNVEIVEFLVLTNPTIFLEMMFGRSHIIFNKRTFRLQTGLRMEYFIVAFSRANRDE